MYDILNFIAGCFGRATMEEHETEISLYLNQGINDSFQNTQQRLPKPIQEK
jgi:hypothetical protein